jgi:TolA-binding protein
VVLISANGVLTAPAGLSAAIAATALAGTTILTAATATVGKAIAMTTMQKALVTAAIAAAIGTGIYEAREASVMRTRLLSLEKGHAEQIQGLQRERDESTNRMAALREEIERLNGNTPELLRLRGQVGLMRQQLAEARQRAAIRAGETNDAPKRWAFGEIKPKAEWRDAGLGSPLAALETFWWAAANTSFERMKQSIVFDRLSNSAPASDLYATREAEFNAGFLEGLEDAGLSIVSLNRANMPTNSAEIEVELSGRRTPPDGSPVDIVDKQRYRLFNVDGEWKVGRDEKLMRLKLFEDDSDAVAKFMLNMPPQILEKIKADPRLPLRTLQAYEALKAKSQQ